MSKSSSSSSLRRHSFPLSSPPKSPHLKRRSDPSYSKQLFEKLKQNEKEVRETKEHVGGDFAALKNPHGRQYSTEENRLLLAILHGIMIHEDVDASKACRILSSFSGAHHSTLSALLSAWTESNIVPSPDTSSLGKASPQHRLHLQEFSLEVEQAIHRIIQERNQTIGFINTADIQSILKDDFGIEMSRRGVARRLHALGYLWGRSRTMGGMNYAARIARGVTYMKELSLALEQEKLGNAIIAFTDESYVNVRHKIEYTWFSPYTTWKNEVGGPGGKGEREIILHAITKHGLLGGDCSSNADVSKTLPSGREFAQHIFLGGYIGEDYHKNINGDFFVAWLSNRFIPAFVAAFPGKKCILVLDNATYHHALGPEYFKLGGTKAELSQKLKTLGVESIQVERDKRKVFMRSSSWIHRKSNFAPSAAELLNALKVELPKHPERQRTAVQRLFDERGWQLIYTPPYTPEVQPIEKVWAYVKHVVASHFTPKRTATTLHVDIIMAFYGDPPSLHPGVTPELCSFLIDHAYEWCDHFIQEHMQEEGNLSTLASWLHENPQEEAIPDESQDIQEGVGEEIEEEHYDVFEFEEE